MRDSILGETEQQRIIKIEGMKRCRKLKECSKPSAIVLRSIQRQCRPLDGSNIKRAQDGITCQMHLILL
jgi:hypothetical protein